MPDQADATAAVLHLDGPMTIGTIDAVRTRLLDRLWSAPSIELDCAAEEVDISFVQLLIAARKTAELAGKTFELSPATRSALRATLVRGGFITEGGPVAGLSWLAGEDRP